VVETTSFGIALIRVASGTSSPPLRPGPHEGLVGSPGQQQDVGAQRPCGRQHRAQRCRAIPALGWGAVLVDMQIRAVDKYDIGSHSASYSVWRSTRAIRVVRAAAPLFLLFLQEICSEEGLLRRRNPGVLVVLQSEKQRTRNNLARCSYLIC